MDDIAKQTIAEAEKNVNLAKAQLKIVRILAQVKPHLRQSFLDQIEIAADQAGIPLQKHRREL